MARRTSDDEQQHIEDIDLALLDLWPDNPRDPCKGMDNEQLIRHALESPDNGPWQLKKLNDSMGHDFDKSELPTVVPRKKAHGRYLVMDGNRRVMIAMINAEMYHSTAWVQMPAFPGKRVIPCNVCTFEEAVDHVLRKHSDAGSWKPLQRDRFLETVGRMKNPSNLLRLEKETGLISKYPKLNQVYVDNDILNSKNLAEFGLDPNQYDFGVDRQVLADLLERLNDKLDSGELSSRNKRNSPVELFTSDPILEEIKESIKHHIPVQPPTPAPRPPQPLFDLPDDSSEYHEQGSSSETEKPARRSPQVSGSMPEVFGGPLHLPRGDANNLYRTLECLWKQNRNKQIKQDEGFVPWFCAGLRLLGETAARQIKIKKGYSSKDIKASGAQVGWLIDTYGEAAQKQLRHLGDPTIPNFLKQKHVQIKGFNIVIQSAAHDYAAFRDEQYALAVSILLGCILRAGFEDAKASEQAETNMQEEVKKDD